jgi:hypothetical protein
MAALSLRNPVTSGFTLFPYVPLPWNLLSIVHDFLTPRPLGLHFDPPGRSTFQPCSGTVLVC